MGVCSASGVAREMLLLNELLLVLGRFGLGREGERMGPEGGSCRVLRGRWMALRICVWGGEGVKSNRCIKLTGGIWELCGLVEGGGWC